MLIGTEILAPLSLPTTVRVAYNVFTLLNNVLTVVKEGGFTSYNTDTEYVN